MPTIALYFRTAPLALPAILVMFLVAGLAYPIYDYVQARKYARRTGQPMPGPSFLLREIAESQILACLLVAVGLLVMSAGLLLFFMRSDAEPRPIMVPSLYLLGGLALLGLAQAMVRKSDKRMRGWRYRNRRPD